MSKIVKICFKIFANTHKCNLNLLEYQFSTLHYQLGKGEESLNEIRECLRLDHEHKDCWPFYKKVKKVAKFLTAAQEAQNTQDLNKHVICAQNCQIDWGNQAKMVDFGHKSIAAVVFHVHF